MLKRSTSKSLQRSRSLAEMSTFLSGCQKFTPTYAQDQQKKPCCFLKMLLLVVLHGHDFKGKLASVKANGVSYKLDFKFEEIFNTENEKPKPNTLTLDSQPEIHSLHI